MHIEKCPVVQIDKVLSRSALSVFQEVWGRGLAVRVCFATYPNTSSGHAAQCTLLTQAADSSFQAPSSGELVPL